MKLTKRQRDVLERMANGEILWNDWKGRKTLRPSMTRISNAVFRSLASDWTEVNPDLRVGGMVITPLGRAALERKP